MKSISLDARSGIIEETLAKTGGKNCCQIFWKFNIHEKTILQHVSLSMLR
jgi:hypothetical protein